MQNCSKMPGGLQQFFSCSLMLTIMVDNTISIFKSLAIPYWSRIGGNWIKSRSIMDY